MPWSIYDKPEFKRHETQTDQQVLWHQSRCVVSRNHCQLATLIGCVLTTVQLPASVWRSHDLDETACAEYRTRPACTVPETRQQTNIIINQKHWDSAYLCQGTSYQCHDTDLDLYPDPYPDLWSESPPKFNHLFTGHFQPSLKISCKSVPKFLRKNLPTDRQTDNDENITSLAEANVCYCRVLNAWAVRSALVLTLRLLAIRLACYIHYRELSV